MNIHVAEARGTKVKSSFTPPLPVAQSQDPIFQRIAKHRTIVDKLEAAGRNEIQLSDRQMCRTLDRFCEQAWEMIDNPPMTADGAIALLRYSVEVEDIFDRDADGDSFGWPDGASRSGRPGKIWTDELRRILPEILANPPMEVVNGQLLKNDGPLTIEDASVLDFTPWSGSIDELPNNTDLMRKITAYLPTIQMAWRLNRQTKLEMVRMIETVGDSESEALYHNLERVSEFLQGLHDITSCAESRLLCAGATLVQRTDATAKRVATGRGR